MDTFEVTCRAVEALGLSYESDRLTGQIIIPLTLRDQDQTTGEKYALALDTDVGEVRVCAPRMAGAGGPEGKFQPMLAALAAALAYDYDLQLGMDPRNGEIEARATVQLTGVREEWRQETISWALRSFIRKERRVRARLREAFAATARAALASADVSISA